MYVLYKYIYMHNFCMDWVQNNTITHPLCSKDVVQVLHSYPAAGPIGLRLSASIYHLIIISFIIIISSSSS